MTLSIGDKAPAFTATTDTGETISLDSLKGKTVVLYFYPKDDTPGCTTEACAFRDSHADFESAETVILGVSKDSVDSHQKFRNKYSLPFKLISDEDGAVCTAYGTFVEKSMFGKKYMGIQRDTFLIDRDGVIRQIWRKVKVDGHKDAVMAAIQDLDKVAA